MKREMNMICNKCGQFIPDGVYYCEHCGEPVNQTYTQQPFGSDNQNTQQSTQQTYQQPNAQYNQYNNQYNNPYNQPFSPQAFEYMISSKIEEARTMGIIAIIAGLFIPILGIVFGCIGISKLNEVPLSNQLRYETELKRKKAKNLCTVGIVLPIVLWVIAVIFVVVFWGALIGAMY